MFHGIKLIDNPNNYGWTPLHASCAKAYNVSVSKLIDAGADFSIQDSQGMTPLHISAHYCSYDCCIELIEAGAVIDLINNDGERALEIYGMLTRKIWILS